MYGDDFLIYRFNSDGSSDTSFGNQGSVIIDHGYSDSATSVVLQENGQILIAGYTSDNLGNNHNFCLLRLNANGSLDNIFGNMGIVTTDFGYGEDGKAMAMQADGKVVLVGNSTAWNIVVARYYPDSGFLYDPQGQFEWLAVEDVATDTFDYSVFDGSLTSTATVTFTITGVNDAPIAVSDAPSILCLCGYNSPIIV